MLCSQAHDVKLKVVEAAQGVLGVASAVVKPVQHGGMLRLKESRHQDVIVWYKFLKL